MRFRFLIARRVAQFGFMLLFIGANVWGWKFVQGNLAFSKWFGTVPLSDPFAVMQIFATGIVAATDVLVGAVIVVVVYAALLGRAFCSWVCPMNLVTDGANFLRRVFKMDEIERKVWVARSIRYWLIGLSIALSALFGVAAFEMINPVSMLYRGVVFGMGFGWAAVAAVFFFDLFVLRHGFCGHICPIGGIYSIIGAKAALKVAYDKQKCTLCMKCTEICPEKQVLQLIGKQSGSVDGKECTRCGRCIEACADNALKFKLKF